MFVILVKLYFVLCVTAFRILCWGLAIPATAIPPVSVVVWMQEECVYCSRAIVSNVGCEHMDVLCAYVGMYSSHEVDDFKCSIF